MEMPKPGDAHKKLEKLVGSWSGEEKMSPSPWDPAGGTAAARINNKLAIDGFNVVQDYEQERGGVVNFRGHGVFSYDTAGKCYTLHWFDSMGMAPNVFKGNFEGEVLTMTSQSPQASTQAIFDLREPGRYTFKMSMSPDGKQWHPMMEGKYQRK